MGALAHGARRKRPLLANACTTIGVMAVQIETKIINFVVDCFN